MSSKLRAVPPLQQRKQPGRRRQPRKFDSVAKAAAVGSHRDLLVSMRDRIASAVSAPDCPPRDLAALTRRLQDIAREIEAIDQQVEQQREDDDARVGDQEFNPASV